MSFGLEDLIVRALATVPAVAAAWLSLKTSRTPQGSAAWIVLILAYPYVGVPAYALFGYANYSRFAQRRRASDAQVGVDGPDADRAPDPEDRLAIFARLGGSQVTHGNAMTLLIDGQATFDAIFDAIGRAERYVLVQYYTIEDDALGRRLRDLLIARARAGVEVWLLHDELPLVGLPRSYWQALRAAGVHTARPKGPSRALGPFQLNYRNHRKLVVVDGTEAFTGGLNCSETYMGRNPRYGDWRDTFCRLTGPVVLQLQRGFAADWSWAAGDAILDRLDTRSAVGANGPVRAVALAPAPTDRVSTGNLYFIALATAARERLWITTPYFVPDSDVLSALQLAALRGVDVRILVPDRPDHRLPYWAAFSYFDELRIAGGEIWRYEGAFMHQKVALVDDDICSVGSINLDIRSGLLNFELTVVMQDRAAAAWVEAMLNDDLARCHKLDRWLPDQPVGLRVLARTSRLLAPQM
ncbi:cardiolipin synthase [Palleronia sediminis]|uniref:Cardiolipin synthase n=1 Tax=Palleronia sediminis TaxID=2547833 RepID=A0A4R5ZVD8_9RHOB|nr:cardiolipin synthase [Palleronia sediminis]TDL75011.1 cardiolipin synthase [Palleronia sediminis]